MSLAQRFERRLEGMVGSAFARVFKGQVEPVEIGSALQREAIDKKSVMGGSQVLVPNRYRVTLSQSDYDRLSPWEAQLCQSLAELIQEHIDDHSLKTVGDVEVFLALDPELHTGVFGVASRMEAQAPPRRRPYDSMSMPVVAGHLDEYIEPFGSHLRPDPAAPPAYPPAQPAYPPAQPPYPQQPHAEPPYAQPSRRPQLRARLLVDGTPQAIELKGGSNIIGRGHEADLQLLDQGVSRRHLDVHLADGSARAYDLGSTNGTTVNGHRIENQILQHGDVIRLGHSRLVYQQDA